MRVKLLKVFTGVVMFGLIAPLTEWFKDQHVSDAIIGGAAIRMSHQIGNPRFTATRFQFNLASLLV